VLAIRFVQLMLLRNCFYQSKKIIREIEKSIDKQKGIEEVHVETAVLPEEKLLAGLKEKAKLLSGAQEVRLSLQLVPDLIGGFRIRWRSMLFDGSIKGHLQKMAGNFGARYSGEEA